jgi:hypothetical protein
LCTFFGFCRLSERGDLDKDSDGLNKARYTLRVRGFNETLNTLAIQLASGFIVLPEYFRISLELEIQKADRKKLRNLILSDTPKCASADVKPHLLLEGIS